MNFSKFYLTSLNSISTLVLPFQKRIVAAATVWGNTVCTILKIPNNSMHNKIKGHQFQNVYGLTDVFKWNGDMKAIGGGFVGKC